MDLFGSLSWYDIDAVCPSGVCMDGGTLNGYDMTGWIWAGLDEIGAMLGVFTGHDHVNDTFNYSTRNSTWAPSFLNAFRPNSVDRNRGMLIGITRFRAYNPFVGEITPGSVHITDFYAGGCCVTDSILLWPVSGSDWSQDNFGSWFYRAEVPTPASLPLIVIALTFLYHSRHRKA
ncbi:MAG: hypothetical protein R3E50_02215 [Halioglobus sp.]